MVKQLKGSVDLEKTVWARMILDDSPNEQEMIIELTSQIPIDTIKQRIKNNKSECWNCGMDCSNFVPKSERLDDDKNHFCSSKKRAGLVWEHKKRCSFKKVLKPLRVEPEWIDEFKGVDDDE